VAQDPNAAPGTSVTGGEAGGEVRHERGERGGRGRRGRRRGRRGGGGGGSRDAAAPGGNAGGAMPQDFGGDDAAPAHEGNNGSHDAAPDVPQREPPPPREYHAEPRDSGPAHEPLAHFEPAPRPEGSAENKQPYVVWSSAPAEKPAGSRGPDE
jgi:hypothetical protein